MNEHPPREVTPYFLPEALIKGEFFINNTLKRETLGSNVTINCRGLTELF